MTMLGIPELQKSIDKLAMTEATGNRLSQKANDLSQAKIDLETKILDGLGRLIVIEATGNDLKVEGNAKLQELLDILNRTGPAMPGEVDLKVTSQIVLGEKTMLKFDVVLPAIDTTNPNNSDIATRTLSVSVAGAAAIVTKVTDLTTASVSNDAFVGNANDAVALSLVDSDASGNASPSRDESVTLTDTIAPAQPGDFTLKITGQV
jgi:hypothetical protein